MILLEDIITDDSLISIVRKKNDAISSGVTGVDIYTKMFNPNEFIGQRLAGIRNLRTNKYFLVSYGDKCRITRYKNLEVSTDDIMIGSFDFKKPGKYYLHLSDFGFSQDALFKIMVKCPSEKNRFDLAKEILEMFALDTFMGQQDRFNNNIIFECDQHDNLHLVPIFDYEMSFDTVRDEEIYHNPLFELYDVADYKMLFKYFPEFRTMLESYVLVDLEKEIREAFKDRRLRSDIDLYEYREFGREKQKQLIRILR